MRWKIIFGLMILLSFSFVLAGNSYDVSFEGQNSQAIYLYEDDEVRFELLDGEHSLIVEEVTTTGAKFDVVPFIHDEITNAWPGIVTLDTIMKVDLDKDGYNDLNVALYTVAADGEVHLVLQVADEVNVVDDNIVTGLVVDEDEESNVDWKNYLLAFLGILIVVVIAVFVLRSADSSEEIKEEKKEEKEEETKEEEKEEEKEEAVRSNFELY